MNKKMKFSEINYMVTVNKNELKDMYKEVRQYYPNNILKIKKECSAYFIIVMDFIMVYE